MNSASTLSPTQTPADGGNVAEQRNAVARQVTATRDGPVHAFLASKGWIPVAIEGRFVTLSQ